MGIRVGLDFGTSNSGIAVYDGQKVRLLPIERGSLLPEVVKSILYITRDYQAYIGQEAIEHYYRQNVGRQRRYVRQRAGEIEYFGGDMEYIRDVYVYVDELQPGRLLQFLKTALRKGIPGGYEGTRIFERFYKVGDLVQVYLHALKERAEQLLGERIDGATLGRPVRFSEHPALDRQAEETLRLAALSAGFNQVDFELEPVAAARSYELSLEKAENVLVFDFGGGTLDIALLRLGDPRQREVYASRGIDIAGSDFDRAIIQKRMLPAFGFGQVHNLPEVQELIQAVPDWMALPELGTPQNRHLLEKAIRAGIAPVRLKALHALIYDDLAFSFYNRVEAAKIALSDQGAALISVAGRNIDLWEMYTRAQFENDIHDYLDRVQAIVLEAVAASGLEPGQIDRVVKTGGSSSIPLFTHMLQRLFGQERVRGADPFSSVVAGLAVEAARRG